MNLQRLRWITFVVPTLLATLLLTALHALVPGLSDSWWGLVVETVSFALGAYFFSTWVYRLLLQSERRIYRKTAQLQALGEATLSITGELSLEAVLQKVADRGRELLAARYCALQTFGPADLGGSFLTSGMAPEVAERIGLPPRGLGVLGVVRHTGRSLRVRDVTRHPAYIGYPPHHPPMHSFLGVPIRSKGNVLGLLYLTEKLDAAEFSPEDEEVATQLATQAAVAVENARLFEQVRRTGKYLERLIQDSRDAIVTLTLDGRVHMWNSGAEALYGLTADEARGCILPMVDADEQESTFALLQCVALGEAKTNLEVDHCRRDGTRVPVLVTLSLVAAAFGEAPGVLMIAKDLTPTRRLEAQRRRLALLEDRERIGMDLHDGAIQALYAIGLSLEALKRMLPRDGDAVQRLVGNVAQLNTVIQDLRAYILDQRPRGLIARTLDEGLQELANRLRAGSVTAEVKLAAADAEDLPSEVVAQLLTIAGEAVSNVLRHAGAQRARLEFTRRGDRLRLLIADDGQGFPEAQGISEGKLGLRNMQARSQLLGGECTIASVPGRGTEVLVEVPLEGMW